MAAMPLASADAHGHYAAAAVYPLEGAHKFDGEDRPRSSTG